MKTIQLSGLTDYELELEKIIDKIKAEQSTLKAIGILRRTIDQFRQLDVSKSVCRCPEGKKGREVDEDYHQICEVCGGS